MENKVYLVAYYEYFEDWNLTKENEEEMVKSDMTIDSIWKDEQRAIERKQELEKAMNREILMWSQEVK